MGISPDTYKARTIEQWTADPCAAVTVDDEPGGRDYFTKLIEGRNVYAPWMAQELDYEGSQDLKVLDVGCGQGIDLARYSMAGAEATGIDLTPRHVELAGSHLSALGLNAEIIEGDAEALPFSEQTFDKVSSNGVLHHTPDMSAALRSINRVLKPRGKATIIVYNRQSLHYWLQQVVYHGLWKRKLFKMKSMEEVLSRVEYYSLSGTRPLVRVYSPKQLRSMLQCAGFSDVTVNVRHFLASDAWPTAHLEPFLPWLRDPKNLDRIGRRVGWYVIGRGTRPR